MNAQELKNGYWLLQTISLLNTKKKEGLFVLFLCQILAYVLTKKKSPYPT